MLKRFEVENFKGFSEPLIFDLSARDYGFNKHLVNNGIVNKAIVYGKNGIGKTSLGIAVLDIISHLTDKEQFPALSKISKKTPASKAGDELRPFS